MGLIIRKTEKTPTAEREKDQNPGVLKGKTPEKKARREVKKETGGERRLSVLYSRAERDVDVETDSAAASFAAIAIALEGNGREDGVVENISPVKSVNALEDLLAKTDMSDRSIADRSRLITSLAGPLSEVVGWRQAQLSSVGGLEIELASAKREALEVAAMRDKEEGKNIFGRLFNGAVREQLERALIRQTEVEDVLIRRLNEGRTALAAFEGRIDSALARVSQLQKELAATLIKNIDTRYKEVADEMISPERIAAMNDKMLAELKSKFLEEHPAFKIDENLRAGVDEYVELLRQELPLNSRAGWYGSEEEIAAIRKRRNKMDILNADSHYNLKEFSSGMGVGNIQDSADENYRTTANLLVGELSQRKQAEVLSRLPGVLPDEQPVKLPYGVSNYPIEKFSGDMISRFGAVWLGLKEAGVDIKEAKREAESKMITRFYHEMLTPGGRESWSGTAAASFMQKLNNPEALPVLLEHIRSSGSGHTTNVCVYAMESLLVNSDRGELARVTDGLPGDRQKALALLADDESFLNKFGRLNARYATARFLQDMDLTIARETLTRVLSEDKKSYFSQSTLQAFFGGIGPEDESVIPPLVRRRKETEAAIIESGAIDWSRVHGKLLTELTNPKNGEPAEFALRILREGLLINEEDFADRLFDIHESKFVRGSKSGRKAIVDGLLLLNSKQDGKESAEMLLSTYRLGNKNDPKRLCRIFQLAATLNDFGEYAIVTPPQKGENEMGEEITKLRVRLAEEKDKEAKKELKDKITTAERELNNLTGLKGIEDAMSAKVTDIFCVKLNKIFDIRASDARAIRLREGVMLKMEDSSFLKVLNMVTSLSGRYETIGAHDTSKLLSVIVEHIIDGDFKEWRYGNAKGVEQLAILTESGREAWIDNLDQEGGADKMEALRVTVSEEESAAMRAERQLEVVRFNLSNLRDHFKDRGFSFDFSEGRLFELEAEIEKERYLVLEASHEVEKQIHLKSKRKLEAELATIASVLQIEKMPKEIVSAEALGPIVESLENGLMVLDAGVEVLRDAGQLRNKAIFNVKNFSEFIAKETDDPVALLNVGTEPQETCQSWRNGGYNECLPAYVADANKKVVNVYGDDGAEVIGRSIIKLLSARNVVEAAPEGGSAEGKKGDPVILAESFYSLYANPDIYRAFGRKMFSKGDAIGGAMVAFGHKFPEFTMTIIDEEAARFGYRRAPADRPVEMFVPQSNNSSEYSDSMGGKISTFNTHRQFNGVVYEKI